jgi:predicted nuclease with TOPRIM domain
VPVCAGARSRREHQRRLRRARQKLDEARKQGNELAAAFTEADHKLEETQPNIDKLKVSRSGSAGERRPNGSVSNAQSRGVLSRNT